VSAPDNLGPQFKAGDHVEFDDIITGKTQRVRLSDDAEAHEMASGKTRLSLSGHKVSKAKDGGTYLQQRERHFSVRAEQVRRAEG
jgi:hypothetical protein